MNMRSLSSQVIQYKKIKIKAHNDCLLIYLCLVLRIIISILFAALMKIYYISCLFINYF